MAAAAFATPAILGAVPKRRYVWANLLQLGENMWNDKKTNDTLLCDERVEGTKNG